MNSLEAFQERRVGAVIHSAMSTLYPFLAKQKITGVSFSRHLTYSRVLNTDLYGDRRGLPRSIVDLACSIVISNPGVFPRGTLQALLALKTYRDSIPLGPVYPSSGRLLKCGGGRG